MSDLNTKLHDYICHLSNNIIVCLCMLFLFTYQLNTTLLEHYQTFTNYEQGTGVCPLLDKIACLADLMDLFCTFHLPPTAIFNNDSLPFLVAGISKMMFSFLYENSHNCVDMDSVNSRHASVNDDHFLWSRLKVYVHYLL